MDETEEEAQRDRQELDALKQKIIGDIEYFIVMGNVHLPVGIKSKISRAFEEAGTPMGNEEAHIYYKGVKETDARKLREVIVALGFKNEISTTDDGIFLNKYTKK